MTETADEITDELDGLVLTVEEGNTIIAALAVAGDAVTKDRAERIVAKIDQAMDRWASA